MGTSNETLNQDNSLNDQDNSLNYIDTVIKPKIMNFKDRIKKDQMVKLIKLLEEIDLNSPGIVQEIFES